MVCLPVPTGPRVFGAFGARPRGEGGGGVGVPVDSGPRSPEALRPPRWGEESLAPGEGGPKLALLLAFGSGASSSWVSPHWVSLSTQTPPPSRWKAGDPWGLPDPGSEPALPTSVHCTSVSSLTWLYV